MTSPTSLVHSFEANGSACVGVLAKRSYRLGSAAALDAPAEIYERAILRPIGNDDAELRHDSDLWCFHKSATDVIALASAHSSHGPVRSLDVGLTVGPVRRFVRVHGDRHLCIRGGAPTFGETEGFERMSLDWTRAYGGRDVQSEMLNGDLAVLRRSRRFTSDDIRRFGTIAYPRNRVGVGFYLDRERERLDHVAVPNIEDPEDPVRPERMLAAGPLDWLDRPIAAGFAPIDGLTFPRACFGPVPMNASRHSRSVREVEMGVLHHTELAPRSDRDVRDPRLASCAAAGLGVCQLHGGESYHLYHLHPSRAVVEGRLPGERPRLLVEPPRTRVYELEPKLATVLFEPDEDRVTLTWAGSMPVAAVFPEEMCKEMRHGVLWS
jgi:hypothetical protein